MRIFFVLFYILAFNSYLWGKDQICAPLIEVQNHSTDGLSLHERLFKLYPSCAPWLEKACFGPFKLDKPISSLINSDGFGFPLPSDCSDKGNPLMKLTEAEKISDLLNSIQKIQNSEKHEPYREEIARKALENWSLIHKKRELDLAEILKVFEKEQAPLSLSPQEVDDATKTFVKRTKKAAKSSGSKTRLEIEDFISDQMIETAEDVVIKTELSPKNFKEDIYPGYKSVLAKLSNDKERFNELVKRASQIDSGHEEDFSGNLTPYHSKQLLLYHLDNFVSTKYKSNPIMGESILNGLANKLNLKIDTSKNNKATWSSIIAHDGFMLGANPNQMLNLLSKDSKTETQKSGTGIDCATYVQNILKQVGYSIDGRLTSYGISSKGQLNNIAKVEKIDSDTTSSLMPGDLVITRSLDDPIGHVQIVVGFEGDPPELVVISAEGGYQRGIVKRKINLYEIQPTYCGERNYYNSNQDDHVYYKATLKKAPNDKK